MKSKFKVGDEVIVTGYPHYVTIPGIVTLVKTTGAYPYRVRLKNSMIEELFLESNLRKPTKLERALM